MTAPHFFTPSVAGDTVTLEGEEARHATRVLRVRPGEVVTVSDGEGTVVEARVSSVGDHLVAEVTARRAVPQPRPRLTVWQAIPKAGRLDLVVQKLTELGAAEIVPFPARRGVSRWDPGDAARRVERLRAIAREAAKQSRRGWLPRVGAPGDLASLRGAPLVLHEGATSRLREALPSQPPSDLTLVVGPEGGLDDDEVASLVAAGGVAVSLGPLILRTETAALAAAAVVLFRYGLLG